MELNGAIAPHAVDAKCTFVLRQVGDVWPPETIKLVWMLTNKENNISDLPVYTLNYFYYDFTLYKEDIPEIDGGSSIEVLDRDAHIGHT